MHDLYFDQPVVNLKEVSVQSAFICMLHLANEKGLSFDPNDDTEGIQSQLEKEADFEIKLDNRSEM